MEHDASDAGEARYELVISVDARRSGQYGDAEKPRMRERIYRILDTAFAQAGVDRRALYTGDRGDGVLMAVPGRIAVTRLLGLWMVEVHESLREENSSLRVPLGLRIAMHVGPVRHDSNGINGRAVDLACRLADADVGRRLLDAEGADLVLVVSGSLYHDVVSAGGKFILPERFAPAELSLKEGEFTGWFHLPGRARPDFSRLAAQGPAEGGEDSGSRGDGPLPEDSGGRGDGPRPVDAAGRDDGPLDDGGPAADDEGRGDGPARYVAGGDLSVNRDNVYHQPVHIGRTVDSDRRKG
ncbi:hypothetical protein [Streptomyces sp. sk226]|uniref:hypothetical protein n=1 Tax=Streptomyces sp. sk226 TaxID=2034268 RepID=UPI000BEF51A6|nr:hypothetical protein [Streptomyces sp. sk226]